MCDAVQVASLCLTFLICQMESVTLVYLALGDCEDKFTMFVKLSMILGWKVYVLLAMLQTRAKHTPLQCSWLLGQLCPGEEDLFPTAAGDQFILCNERDLL